MKINFIILFIFISLSNIILSENQFGISPKILKKDEKVLIDEDANVVVFDSDSFSEGDKMSFKITAAKFEEEDIMFEFYDDYDFQDFTMENDESPEKKKDAQDVYDSNDWSGEGTTYFYTIKKDKKYFKTGVKGKYLGIFIDAQGKILVENYKKEVNMTIVIIIVVVVVVIIIALIICYCVKRRKQLAEMNNGYNGNNAYVNNNPNQGNYGQQQNNPNYNMNMNMNQRPQGNNGYNNNGYNKNNMGYNNNAYNNNNMGYNNNNNIPYTNNPQQYNGVPQNSNTMRYG